MIAIVDALRVTTELRVTALDVSFNKLTNLGLSTLAELLSAADEFVPALRELNVKGNDVAEEGCAYFMQALAGNASLRVLDLSGNPIGPDGGMAVANMLKVRAWARGARRWLAFAHLRPRPCGR